MTQIRDFDEFDFRDHYRDAYSGRGVPFDYYEPAYRFGYDLAFGYPYRNRDWLMLEADARRAWERRHPKQPWEEVSDAVRHSWEQVRRGFHMPDPYDIPLRMK